MNNKSLFEYYQVIKQNDTTNTRTLSCSVRFLLISSKRNVFCLLPKKEWAVLIFVFSFIFLTPCTWQFLVSFALYNLIDLYKLILINRTNKFQVHMFLRKQKMITFTCNGCIVGCVLFHCSCFFPEIMHINIALKNQAKMHKQG